MQTLLALLEQELGEPVEANTPLVSAGIIDSLRFAELLEVLQKHFHVEIDPGEVGVDNFDTPAQILDFVRERA